MGQSDCQPIYATEPLESEIRTAKKIEKNGLNPQDDIGKGFIERLEKGDYDGKVTMEDVTAHRQDMEKVLRDIGEPGKGVKVNRESASEKIPDALAHALPNSDNITIFDKYFDQANGVYEIVHEMGHASLGRKDELPDGAGIYVGNTPDIYRQLLKSGGFRIAGYRYNGIKVANEFGVELLNDRFVCGMGFDEC